MQKPLISVCIPTYNRPVEIQEAIESVIVQLDDETRSLVEIVVSHDPGAENEAEVQKVLQEMVKKYDTVRYFKNEKNMRFSNGLIANEHATGEYLMPLSDDDYLTEFSISYLLEIIEKTNFDFLLHKAVFTPDVHIPIISTPNTYSVYQ